MAHPSPQGSPSMVPGDAMQACGWWATPAHKCHHLLLNGSKHKAGNHTKAGASAYSMQAMPRLHLLEEDIPHKLAHRHGFTIALWAGVDLLCRREERQLTCCTAFAAA